MKKAFPKLKEEDPLTSYRDKDACKIKEHEPTATKREMTLLLIRLAPYIFNEINSLTGPEKCRKVWRKGHRCQSRRTCSILSY